MTERYIKNEHGKWICVSYGSGEFQITRKCDEGYLTVIRTKSKESDSYEIMAILEDFPESIDREGLCINENISRKKWKTFRDIIFNTTDWRINRIFRSLEEKIYSMQFEAILD